MKIINKSGNEEVGLEDAFYILLDQDVDRWEGVHFFCESGSKYNTEESAVKAACPGLFIAKVTLVAKIV